MKFLRHPATRFSVIGLITVIGLVLRIPGLERSLWLDEAWVANSVLEPTLWAMFHYSEWLQTSPPLFLVMVRALVTLFGVSNEVFRLVPMFASLLCGTFTLFLLDRFFPGRRYWVAPFAWAFVMLTPQALEYAQALKQYSTESATVAALLWVAWRYVCSPSRANYYWLLAVVALAPALAYPSVFLLPGVVLLVAPRWRRVLGLAGTGAVVFSAIYVIQIQPNSAVALRQHWASDYAGHSALLALAMQTRQLAFLFSSDLSLTLHPKLTLLPFIPLAMSCLLGRRRRKFVLAAFWLPLGLSLVADRLSIYPLSPRTGLFLLPCFALAFSAAAAGLVVRFRGGARQLVAPLLLVLSLVYVARSIQTQPDSSRGIPVEQAEEAITYLYSRVQADDGIYVHASMQESYRHYARRFGFDSPQPVRGQTSWPCCPRGREFPRGKSNAATVREDLARAVQTASPRRWWVVWTDRQEHWDWVAMDDRPVIRDYFSAAGCTERVVDRFHNVGLLLYSCDLQK